MNTFRALAASLVVLGMLAGPVDRAQAQSFRVRLDTATPGDKPVQRARVVVAVIGPGAKLPPRSSPHEAPFWDDPQPIFGKTVQTIAQGDSVLLADDADAFPVPLSKLPPGEYRAAARLLRPGQSADGWRQRDGNFMSEVIAFTIPDDPKARAAMPPVDIGLNRATAEPAHRWKAGSVEEVRITSRLLSDFHGSPVELRAAVVLPADFDPARKYAAVYEIPGFGGRHFDGIRQAGRSPAKDDTSPSALLRRGTFRVVLDPDSPNGHTLFADSAVNGPWTRALVEELIPAIEAKHPQLVARPGARLLRGHSSGGWSSLWLALKAPQTFGAAWSSSPDPVDFRRFQLVNIYEDANMYRRPTPGAAAAPDLPSYRRGGRELMTIRQENGGERVIGPGVTSGMQWASWQAVAGPKPAGGAPWQPAALFDPVTGDIDRAVAEKMRAYDIGHLLRSAPETYAPIFRDSIRLVCGDADNFYLEEAVKLLKADADRLVVPPKPGAAGEGGEPARGYIKLVPGADHGSVFASAELRGFAAEMIEHLRREGLLPE